MATEKEIAFWERVFVACVQGATANGRPVSPSLAEDAWRVARDAVAARRKEFPERVADHRELDPRREFKRWDE